MGTKQFRLLWVALLSLSGVLPAATDNQASGYLPLAVGNSWTYAHEYYIRGDGGRTVQEYSAYADQWPAPGEPFRYPEFTISVLNTEVIDGKTYYVIGDMPANWPPTPPHFIAGKKLRWEGTHLMERTADGERSVFRFDGANDTGYTVETVAGSILVKTLAYYGLVNSYVFNFHLLHPGFDLKESRGCGFDENYGLVVCDQRRLGGPIKTIETGEQKTRQSSVTFNNRITSLRAVLGGHPVVYKDLLTPASISPSSWGQVKKEAQ